MNRKLSYLFAVLLLPLFAGGQTTAPSTQPRYVLHSGDTIELVYRLSPEFNQSVTIQPDGHASLNLGGDILLTGLNIEQVKALVLEKASTRLNDPELNVILSDFQRPSIVVGGEVERPGRFEVRGSITAMQAILLAGGARETGMMTRVVIYRHINEEMGEVHVLNLAAMRKNKDLSRDLMLEAGDMVLVTVNKLETFSRYTRALNFSTYIPQSVF